MERGASWPMAGARRMTQSSRARAGELAIAIMLLKNSGMRPFGADVAIADGGKTREIETAFQRD